MFRFDAAAGNHRIERIVKSAFFFFSELNGNFMEFELNYLLKVILDSDH